METTWGRMSPQRHSTFRASCTVLPTVPFGVFQARQRVFWPFKDKLTAHLSLDTTADACFRRYRSLALQS